MELCSVLSAKARVSYARCSLIDYLPVRSAPLAPPVRSLQLLCRPLLDAFRPAAMDAGEAAGFPDEPRLAAFRAERPEHRFGSASCTADLVLCDPRVGYCQEPGVDHVALEDLADRGNQRRHITAVGPLSATGIEHLLQLVCHERHIPATPQDGADHAGERQDPRIVLQV